MQTKVDPKWVLILLGFFALSLAPRLHGGLTFGRDLDGPGTFRMVNYDEAGSCRATMSEFRYPTFTGHQITWIAKALGYDPPLPGSSDRIARSYCHSRPLIMIHRIYSAVTGSLTVVLIGILALMMWPKRPQIAWTACIILGFSNLHVAQSHWGTTDAPQVFFLYLLTIIVAYTIVSGRTWLIWVTPILLIGAVWAKWNVFATFVYVAIAQRLLKRTETKYAAALAAIIVLIVLVIGWDSISDVISRRSYLFWGNETSRFGTGYGNIGTWRRWIRNMLNLPIVHIVGLGLPACLFVWKGFKHALADRKNRLLWLTQAPAVVYALYMLVLGPVTNYRHYLLLLPSVALLAAYGLWESRWSGRRLFLVLFLVYPLLLTVDSEYNYRADPRRELRSWYQGRGDPPTYITYYVITPSTLRNVRLFSPDHYLQDRERYLSRADYLILSENWYDTSYPNELNGPIAWKPEWLIKTKPDYVTAYRRILSGQDPQLELDKAFTLKHFMPEFLVHRFFYGSFQLFVGDLRIYRIVHK